MYGNSHITVQLMHVLFARSEQSFSSKAAASSATLLCLTKARRTW